MHIPCQEMMVFCELLINLCGNRWSGWGERHIIYGKGSFIDGENVTYVIFHTQIDILRFC